MNNDLLSDLSSSFNPSNDFKEIQAYEENGVKIALKFRDVSQITLEATKTGFDAVREFVFQAAVPKSMRLELLPASSSEITGQDDKITQVMKVHNVNL